MLFPMWPAGLLQSIVYTSQQDTVLSSNPVATFCKCFGDLSLFKSMSSYFALEINTNGTSMFFGWNYKLYCFKDRTYPNRGQTSHQSA